jgi:imidazolonepropionase-like amidohydrolase
LIRTFLLGCLVLSAPALARAEGLALRSGRFVDPGSREIHQGTLWLRDGQVVALTGESDVPPDIDPSSVTVLDLEGRWVLPLLCDLRVYPGQNRSPGHREILGVENSARLLLFAGIGSFVDVHTREEARQLRNLQRQSRFHSARIAVGGPPLSSPGGRGMDFDVPAQSVADSAEAQAMISEWRDRPAAERPDLVNLIHDRSQGRPSLDPVVLRTLIHAARELGLPCAVEVGTWADAREALEAGARIVVHLPPGPIPPDVIRLAERRPVQWIPTVAVALDFRRLLSEPEILERPLLRALVPAELLDDYPKVRIPQLRYAEGRELQRELTRSLHTLRAAGVQILAGSDAGGIGTFLGYSLHRELQWLHELGLDPWEVLDAATISAAAVVGRTIGYEPGALADFMILRASPLDEIRATEQIELVIHRGELVDRERLREAVLRNVVEEGPPAPWKSGGGLRLFAFVVAGFAALLLLRRWIRRAAAQAAQEH